MKKVASASTLQGKIGNYSHGFVSAENRRDGHKGQSTGSDPLFFEGERDSNQNGRSEISCTTDLDSVDARLLMRLRSIQTSPAFMSLKAGDKLQHIQKEGQKVLDEVADDGDFQPYSERTKAELGLSNQTQVQLSEATHAANLAHQHKAVAIAGREVAESELQALKREAAESRHAREQAEIEIAQLKAQAALRNGEA